MDDQKTQDTTTKMALAPTQWEALKDSLKSECAKVEAFHRANLVVDNDQIHEATITNLRTGRAVSLRYESDFPRVSVTAGEKAGYLEFRVSFDRKSVQFMDGGIPREPQTIAANLIRRVL